MKNPDNPHKHFSVGVRVLVEKPPHERILPNSIGEVIAVVEGGCVVKFKGDSKPDGRNFNNMNVFCKEDQMKPAELRLFPDKSILLKNIKVNPDEIVRRQIVSIQPITLPGGSSHILALANDGTLWCLSGTWGEKIIWEPLPPLPQK